MRQLLLALAIASASSSDTAIDNSSKRRQKAVATNISNEPMTTMGQMAATRTANWLHTWERQCQLKVCVCACYVVTESTGDSCICSICCKKRNNSNSNTTTAITKTTTRKIGYNELSQRTVRARSLTLSPSHSLSRMALFCCPLSGRIAKRVKVSLVCWSCSCSWSWNCNWNWSSNEQLVTWPVRFDSCCKL